MIKFSISDHQPLYCFGFYLPSFKTRVKFEQEVYFHFCNFQAVDFTASEFLADVHFSGSKFLGRADFGYTKYSALAEFSLVEFHEANFCDIMFLGNVNFLNTTFRKVDFYRTSFRETSDFTSSKFLEVVHFDKDPFNKVNFWGATFNKDVFFWGATFTGECDFSNSKFMKIADFHDAIFSMKSTFKDTNFSNTSAAYFNSVIFEKANDVRFDIADMSHVCFLDTDLTSVRFGDKVKWGGEDNFRVIEEDWFKRNVERSNKKSGVTLGGVLSVYRNLRENYERRRRYDDAGKFFIREMELKRKYRNSSTIPWFKRQINKIYKTIKGNDFSFPRSDYVIRENCWIRRNVSLIGFYYHVSRYGEDLLRPSLFGVMIVILSTVFFVCQSDPRLIPTLFTNLGNFVSLTGVDYTIQSVPDPTDIYQKTDVLLVNSTDSEYSFFIGLDKILDPNQWHKSFERSIVAFLPFLPFGGEFKTGIFDYFIKIIGGIVTFGLIIIALRRRFERKYYH